MDLSAATQAHNSFSFNMAPAKVQVDKKKHQNKNRWDPPDNQGQGGQQQHRQQQQGQTRQTQQEQQGRQNNPDNEAGEWDDQGDLPRCIVSLWTVGC